MTTIGEEIEKFVSLWENADASFKQAYESQAYLEEFKWSQIRKEISEKIVASEVA